VNTPDRVRALIELGDGVLGVVQTVPRAWQAAKQVLRDPVSLDRFAMQCAAAAQALGQLSDRAQQLAGDLLDGEDD